MIDIVNKNWRLRSGCYPVNLSLVLNDQRIEETSIKHSDGYAWDLDGTNCRYIKGDITIAEGPEMDLIEHVYPEQKPKPAPKTLRDEFALKVVSQVYATATAGLAKQPMPKLETLAEVDEFLQIVTANVASTSYLLADAMMAEREKK